VSWVLFYYWCANIKNGKKTRKEIITTHYITIVKKEKSLKMRNINEFRLAGNLKNLQYNDEKKGPLGERAFKTAWKNKNVDPKK